MTFASTITAFSQSSLFYTFHQAQDLDYLVDLGYLPNVPNNVRLIPVTYTHGSMTIPSAFCVDHSTRP